MAAGKPLPRFIGAAARAGGPSDDHRLQLALAGGALVGAGVALLLWRLAPAEPDLADALHRLSPEHAAHTTIDRSGTAGAGWSGAARGVGDEHVAGGGVDVAAPAASGVAADAAGPVLRREGALRVGRVVHARL